MDRALHSLEQLLADLAAVELDTLHPTELGHLAVKVGRGIDKLTYLHARIVTEADRARAWQATGARDAADWLSNQTGTSLGDARSRLRLGEAVDRNNELADAIANDEISAATATQLHDAIVNPSDHTDTDDLSDLIDAAKGARPHEARKELEHWRDRHSTETAEQRTARRFARRSISSKPPVDGLVETTVILPEYEHRQMMNAINHVAGMWATGDDRTTPQRLADGLIQLAAAYAAGQVTGGREKPTILIGCTADTIAGLSDDPGWTSYGDTIPADVIRHLAESAILQRVVMAGNAIINLGTRVRFATDDQYKALVARDGGCRSDGCGIPPAWCEIDHLIPISEGGTTDLDNLVLWCTHHHHVKHRTGVQVIGDANHLTLRMPDGRLIPCPPKHRRTEAAA